MTGTLSGAEKARDTNYKRHGKDFYRKIGRMGGKVSCKGGFACEKVGKDGLTGSERARLVGAIGGSLSSRAGVKNGESKNPKKKTTKKPEKKKGFLERVFGGK